MSIQFPKPLLLPLNCTDGAIQGHQHGACLRENFAKQRQSRSKLCWSIQYIDMEELWRKKKNVLWDSVVGWFSGSVSIREWSQGSLDVGWPQKNSNSFPNRAWPNFPHPGKNTTAQLPEGNGKWQCSAQRKQHCPSLASEKTGRKPLLSVVAENVPQCLRYTSDVCKTYYGAAPRNDPIFLVPLTKRMELLWIYKGTNWKRSWKHCF